MHDHHHGTRSIPVPVWAAALLLTACGEPASGPAPADTDAESAAAGDTAPEPASEAPATEAPTSEAPAADGSADPDLATDDVAYLSRLGLIRGHLRVGMQLYRDGELMHAKSHMKHPGDELYAALEGVFAARGSEGFADELEALAAAVENEAAQADVDAAYESLLAGIASAEMQVADGLDTDAAAQGAIIVNLLETAAEEYGIGVSADGEVTDVHEYQDAYGFTLVAGDRADAVESRVATRSDHAVLQTIVEEIEGLERLWPELVPDATIDAAPSELEAAVARIRTEADRL